ncbi:MAG: arginine repressor [Eubacterium sp.]|nr:arginine repressor [Eubacterium sp.]MCI9412829.1 arginine repressor [Eubacterium sp.]
MKKQRQEKIMEIIRENEVETQEDLARHLNEAGYSVTQATVSRDIREMSLIKVPGIRVKQRYTVSTEGGGGGSSGFGRQYTGVLQDGVVSMEQAGNLLVVKTVSGMAMAVAAAIDAVELEGIVGSIAGDDTILCAVKTEEQVSSVMKSMQSLIHSMTEG